MKTTQYCTVDGFGVSMLSGYGIKGIELNVYASPVTFPTTYFEKAKPFETVDLADAYCLEKGYIREYKPTQEVTQ